MPSNKIIMNALYFIILAGVFVGILALFMGVITININVGGLDKPSYANIIGNGSYFKYLDIQDKFNKLYARLKDISPYTTIDYHYSPLSRTTNHIDDEIKMNNGILPTPPSNMPGHVIPSGLSPNNA